MNLHWLSLFAIAVITFTAITVVGLIPTDVVSAANNNNASIITVDCLSFPNESACVGTAEHKKFCEWCPTLQYCRSSTTDAPTCATKCETLSADPWVCAAANSSCAYCLGVQLCTARTAENGYSPCDGISQCLDVASQNSCDSSRACKFCSALEYCTPVFDDAAGSFGKCWTTCSELTLQTSLCSAAKKCKLSNDTNLCLDEAAASHHDASSFPTTCGMLSSDPSVTPAPDFPANERWSRCNAAASCSYCEPLGNCVDPSSSSQSASASACIVSCLGFGQNKDHCDATEKCHFCPKLGYCSPDFVSPGGGGGGGGSNNKTLPCLTNCNDLDEATCLSADPSMCTWCKRGGSTLSGICVNTSVGCSCSALIGHPDMCRNITIAPGCEYCSLGYCSSSCASKCSDLSSELATCTRAKNCTSCDVGCVPTALTPKTSDCPASCVAIRNLEQCPDYSSCKVCHAITGFNVCSQKDSGTCPTHCFQLDEKVCKTTEACVWCDSLGYCGSNNGTLLLSSSANSFPFDNNSNNNTHNASCFSNCTAFTIAQTDSHNRTGECNSARACDVCDAGVSVCYPRVKPKTPAYLAQCPSSCEALTPAVPDHLCETQTTGCHVVDTVGLCMAATANPNTCSELTQQQCQLSSKYASVFRGDSGDSSCRWTGAFCSSTDCFSFLLQGFYAQPYILFLGGVVKDICVLVFISAYGDNLLAFVLRILKRYSYVLSSCWETTKTRCCSRDDDDENDDADYHHHHHHHQEGNKGRDSNGTKPSSTSGGTRRGSTSVVVNESPTTGGVLTLSAASAHDRESDSAAVVVTTFTPRNADDVTAAAAAAAAATASPGDGDGDRAGSDNNSSNQLTATATTNAVVDEDDEAPPESCCFSCCACCYCCCCRPKHGDQFYPILYISAGERHDSHFPRGHQQYVYELLNWMMRASSNKNKKHDTTTASSLSPDAAMTRQLMVALTYVLIEDDLFIDLAGLRKQEQQQQLRKKKKQQRTPFMPPSPPAADDDEDDDPNNLSDLVDRMLTYLETNVPLKYRKPVYYSSSSHGALRLATNLSQFVGNLQLFFYICGALALIVSTIRQMVIDREQSINAGNPNGALTGGSYYLLVGFRWANSSTLGTMCLIFVKYLSFNPLFSIRLRWLWSKLKCEGYVVHIPSWTEYVAEAWSNKTDYPNGVQGHEAWQLVRCFLKTTHWMVMFYLSLALPFLVVSLVGFICYFWVFAIEMIVGVLLYKLFGFLYLWLKHKLHTQATQQQQQAAKGSKRPSSSSPTAANYGAAAGFVVPPSGDAGFASSFASSSAEEIPTRHFSDGSGDDNDNDGDAPLLGNVQSTPTLAVLARVAEYQQQEERRQQQHDNNHTQQSPTSPLVSSPQPGERSSPTGSTTTAATASSSGLMFLVGIVRFVRTQALPTLVTVIVLQASMNYFILLLYRSTYETNYLTVISTEFHSRATACLITTLRDDLSELKHDISHTLQLLSSVVPFM